MIRWSFSVFLVFVFVSASALAGEFNTVLNVGDPAPGWSDLVTTDGRTSSLADYKDKEFLVVVFTCNTCPVAIDYEDRLVAFAKKHADRVSMVALNVSQAEGEDLQAMKERAAAKQFPFPYVADPSQKIAREFGAFATPEVFLLSPERKILYMGALDDNADASQIKTHYLEDALQAAFAGKAPAVKETLAHGCRIRYARERRSK